MTDTPKIYPPPFKSDVAHYPFTYAHPSLLFNGEAYIPVLVDGKPLWEGGSKSSWNSSRSVATMTRTLCELLLWFRRNPPKGLVLHEPDRNDPRATQNRFYFTEATDAEAFKQVLPSLLKAKEALFPSISKLKAGESFGCAGIMNFSVGEKFKERNVALWLWTSDNAVGKIYEHGKNIVFEKEDDLLLFKLTFTGSNPIEPTIAGITERRSKPKRKRATA